MVIKDNKILLDDLYKLIYESYGEDGENILQDKIEYFEVSVFHSNNKTWIDIHQAYGVMYEIDGEDGENLLQDQIIRES